MFYQVTLWLLCGEWIGNGLREAAGRPSWKTLVMKDSGENGDGLDQDRLKGYAEKQKHLRYLLEAVINCMEQVWQREESRVPPGKHVKWVDRGTMFCNGQKLYKE